MISHCAVSKERALMLDREKRVYSHCTGSKGVLTLDKEQWVHSHCAGRKERHS